MTTVDKGWLESRPRGTVIQVITPTGQRFQLRAEGGAFRDYILHSGTPVYGLAGRVARYGAARIFCSTDLLAEWVAEGLCRIEPVPTNGGAK